MSLLLPDRELYRGNHLDISIEVSRRWRRGLEGHSSLNPEVWCFYLFIAVEQFEAKYHADLNQPVQVSKFGSWHKPYAECLQSLDWQGGMTFYECEKRSDSPFTHIKAGCDYDHIWNDGHIYSANIIMQDAKTCVESLAHQFPNLIPMDRLWKAYRQPFTEKYEQEQANG